MNVRNISQLNNPSKNIMQVNNRHFCFMVVIKGLDWSDGTKKQNLGHNNLVYEHMLRPLSPTCILQFKNKDFCNIREIASCNENNTNFQCGTRFIYVARSW